MPAPQNQFKAALKAGRPQIGLWLGLADPYAAGLVAGAGFDWLVVDGEHAPNDMRSTLGALQAIGTRSHPVVRPPVGEVWMIKQILDLGAQTVLVPMIESLDQAREMVAAMHYPPKGKRGVGAALARASDFGAIGDYIGTAGRSGLPAFAGRKPRGAGGFAGHPDPGWGGRGLHWPGGPCGRHELSRQSSRRTGARSDPGCDHVHRRFGQGGGYTDF